MSYTLVTKPVFRSDADVCPECGAGYIAIEGGFNPQVDFFVCENEHSHYFLETVTGPTSACGELGYWVRR